MLKEKGKKKLKKKKRAKVTQYLEQKISHQIYLNQSLGHKKKTVIEVSPR